MFELNNGTPKEGPFFLAHLKFCKTKGCVGSSIVLKRTTVIFRRDGWWWWFFKIYFFKWANDESLSLGLSVSQDCLVLFPKKIILNPDHPNSLPELSGALEY